MVIGQDGKVGNPAGFTMATENGLSYALDGKMMSHDQWVEKTTEMAADSVAKM